MNRKRGRFRSLLLVLTLAWPLAAGANQAANKQSELDALRKRLEALQAEFRQTQEQRREAVDELRGAELAVSSGVRQLRRIDGERRQTVTTLERLSREADALSVRIRQHQDRLARSLKGAHLRGQGDALKLLLNGEDPNQSARDLRYLAYLSRAQKAQVELLRADLAQLALLQQESRDRTARLEQLHSARTAEQEKLLADQRAREQVLAKLATQIREQRREISNLKRDEHSLTQLVERLNRLMAEQAARAAKRARESRAAEAPAGRKAKVVGVNTETPTALPGDRPFSALRGRLRLPVAGELMNRFGAPREEGGVRWKGLFIRAAQGVAVKAIAAGQVVFADWMRGFGNLIIVDHGEGYMSLYSNNESLYKQVGERVRPGDAIASVGNSGGQSDAGLYFEMRHQSRPINPLSWVQ